MYEELTWNDQTIHTHKIMFDKYKTQLKNKLEKSAFRKGISTGLQGVIKAAVSDHCPITMNFGNVKIASWNLLSDEHTRNLFFDVIRKEYFNDYIVHCDGIKILWRNILEDFANFTLDNSYNNEGILQIKITNELFNAFIVNNKHNTLSKTIDDFAALVLDNTNPNHNDIKISLMHAIEIMYSVNRGYLRWNNRLNKIIENKKLIQVLISHDILCFQECTSPSDMLELLQESSNKYDIDRNFAMISHKIKEQSFDHCVIIYDQNLYQLNARHNFGLCLDSRTKQYKKPCIIAKFLSLRENKPIIVGSIHHPGTGNSEILSIITEANNLSQNDMNIPIFILGDYNHKSKFFNDELSDTAYSIAMPNSGTMAGFEYGNLNSAIDGVLTNYPNDICVDVLNQWTFASQITLPIDIEILI